jgi:hypothetical protein
MAKQTPNLDLTLPSNNEYYNTWDQPINANFTKIDKAVGDVVDEVVTARGSYTDLNSRISVVVDPGTGDPVASPEVQAARVSEVYGGFDSLGAAFSLGGRISQADFEMFGGRQSLTKIVDALAWANDQTPHNTVISTVTNYLTFAGGVVTLNADPVNLCVANINGYRQVLRSNHTTTVTGANGTYYLTLSTQAGGETYVTGTSTATLGVYATNGLVAKLSDSTKNFVTLGVKPGDVLAVTGPPSNSNIGTYVVLATNVEDATNLTVNDLAVYGQFVAANTSISYTVSNPVAPLLSFTGTAHAKTFTRVAGKIYIGRVVLTGGNVTSLTSYQTLGAYAGFTQVSALPYSLTIPHNLGYFPRRVAIYASQANDFSQPLEPLSTADMTTSTLQRSVIAKVDDLNLYLKNPTTGLFYKDFAGTSQTTGYIYAVVER